MATFGLLATFGPTTTFERTTTFGDLAHWLIRDALGVGVDVEAVAAVEADNRQPQLLTQLNRHPGGGRDRRKCRNTGHCGFLHEFK